MPPRLARLLAVVVAVALVGLALVVRGALSDDDEPTTDGDRETAVDASEPSAGDGGSYTIACDADLGDVCADLRPLGDVETLAGGTAITRDLEVDAWVTFDPMPGVRATERGETPPVVEPIGSTTLSLLTSQGGGVECDGPTTCVVDAARSRKVGVPDPITSLGTVVLAALAAAEVPDVIDDGTRVFPDVRQALGGAMTRRTPPASYDQVNRYLTAPGTFDGVITTAGAAERALATARGDNKVAIPLTPEVTVGVVVAGYGERGAGAIDAVTAAVSGETLAAAGFGGDPEASAGLPAADIVYALREELG